MKLLVVAALWPEPSSSAAGRRMVDLLSLFQAEGWTVTYACTAAPSAHCYPLESLAIKTQQINVNDVAFDGFISDLLPDVVLYDRFMVEEQFSWRVDKYCPDALTLLETSDLHCLRHARHTALKAGRQFSESDLSSDIAFREVASIQRTDLSFIISRVEMELLINTFKVDAALIQYYPFTVDPSVIAHEQSKWPSFEERSGFMSIGNFKHAPNWDCVQYLKQTIWPLIRQKLPTAELFIYGAYPPPKAMQLNKPNEGFHVKGRADNVKTVMQSAKVCLAPLRFGAGLKGKLLEAMEYGTPSVTSSIGAEAMHDNLPWNGFIYDDPEAFATAAVELYTNKEQWLEKQKNATIILQQCYADNKFGSSLIERIKTIKANLTTHRQQNFQGSMLKHHLMKSTKYMALWIEAKNKVVE